MKLSSLAPIGFGRLGFATILAAAPLSSLAQVKISELMYHPVEKAVFLTNGAPVLDLSDDVHEFIELHNPGATTVALSNWRLSGGLSYEFPAGTTISAGGYVVVAKDPARLAAVPQYGLTTNQLLGPYDGQLSNQGDQVRLRNELGEVIDAVSYSAGFPWAISADGLGADDEWTGLNSLNYQYRGRSLERVSYTHPATDPANWLASPLNPGPSPGRANAVALAVPRPVVTSISAVQQDTGSIIIRSNRPIVVDVVFSAATPLSGLAVDYFIDDINVANEPILSVPLSVVGAPAGAHYVAVLPGQLDRSIVRYRVRADRGAGVETVSPRVDDPFSWHACFVTPVRTGTNPVYDLFVSAPSLVTLNTNISQSPRRIINPDPPGLPRPSWNATEPGVFVHEGVVRDIQVRYHGSRYNRGAGRNSFKWFFPRYNPFQGTDSIFETDKGDDFFVGHNLFINAGLPVSKVRYVDLYLNNGARLQRLEQGEFNGDMLDAYHRAQRDLYPGSDLEPSGEIYKSVGVISPLFEGPYGHGDGRLEGRPGFWSDVQMYDWTYSLQVHGWKGPRNFKQMLDGLWAARGDTWQAPNPNVLALRAYMEETFDVDEMLTYLSIITWLCPWDDTTQNHFLWQKANGKWGMLPWDCDSWYGRGDNTPATSSIFIGEVGDPNNNSRGPNFIKDSFFKAFRNEYRERLFLLNNTFLHPDNITAMGFNSIRAFANARHTNVNTRCALGVFQRPNRPENLAPAGGTSAFPGAELVASPYSHSDPNAPAHASTTWIIRRSDGTYAKPEVRIASTTNLTSLPIPFGKLDFGQTYFWKCVYTDASQHPSLESLETSFIYGVGPTAVPLVAINAGTLWRYDQSGGTPPADWNQPGFDDSGWSEGPALLGEQAAALPEPIRTRLTVSGANVSYYFRTSFEFPEDPAGVSLRLRQIVDDGVILYLNGVEISRTRMPAGAVTAVTPANAAVNVPGFEGPLVIPATNLVTGLNVIAAEVHQAAANGGDVVFGLSLEAAVPPRSGRVILNELLADNRGSVTNGGTSPDFIELRNNSDLPQSLEQMSLSDNPDRPGKYLFPPGTSIPPRGLLTVWCDDATNAPGLHTGFALDNDGQTVALFAVTPSGYRLADLVTYGLQVPDRSVGRVGTEWTLTVPSPNAPNAAAAVGSPAGLRINEWMATPLSGSDWIELYNPDPLPVALGGLYLTDSPSQRTNTRLAALTYIAPGGFRQLMADPGASVDARRLNFRLSSSGETLILSDAALAVIDAVTFGPQTADVSQGRLPDGASTVVDFPGSASPEAGNFRLLRGVVINEVLTHTTAPAEDQIELFNGGVTSVDLSGWFLSDRLDSLKMYRIPDGTVLGPGAFVVFRESQFGDTNSPTAFSLSGARGDEVFLSAAGPQGQLTGDRVSVRFGPAEEGVSLGRIPTSVGVDFWAQQTSSLGAANGSPRVSPVVVSEIQYHPPDLPGQNDDYEFIEIQNVSASPVNLFDPAYPTNRWRLRDAVDFTFPPQTTLAPGERVLVLGFDPATNTVDRAQFLAAYSIAPGMRLFGPYGGQLDNNGDSVELVKPDAPVAIPGPDFGFVPFILVDRVRYSDQSPWPAGADGGGASLQRRDAAAYGNEPTNWFAAAVSPGTGSSPNAAPVVSILNPVAGALFGVGTPIPLRASASDPDGEVRRVDFFVNDVLVARALPPSFQTEWTDPTPGPQTLIARAVDNRLAAANSAPVSISINPPPRIFNQPTNIFVRPTSNATFRVTASGVGALRYQWFFNGAAIAGATNAAYTLNNAQLGDRGGYSVAVSDGLSTVTSAAAILDLLIEPVIVQQPLSQNVVPGGTVVLSVTVQDNATLPIGYRWRRNGSSLAGGTYALNQRTAFLVITNAQLQFTNYTVVVSNLARIGGLISSNALLNFVADADADGLPDDYETQYGLNPGSAADALDDRDGDGMTNLEEYQAGTDPADAQSFLRIASITAGGGASVVFGTSSNRTYTVQYTDSLGRAPWSRLADVAATSAAHAETVVDRGYTTNRFYRLITPQQP